MSDLLATLWEDSLAAAEAGSFASRSRVADCVLVALCEMTISSRDSSFAATAATLAHGGACTVSGVGRGGPVEAVTANSFLLHAGLADDSYKVAHHPAVTVIPAALAAAEAADSNGDTLLEALVLGYEFSCRLADLFLPLASKRGWRITAVLAPMVASAVAATVWRGPDEAVLAARLGACVTGGPLSSVNGQGDWRIQPALAAAAGFLAATAAEVHTSDFGALEAKFGPLEQIVGGGPAAPGDTTPRLPSVTFKRYGGPMYGQAIYDALENLPAIAGRMQVVTVTVSPFACMYAAQGEVSTDSVTSIKGLTFEALRTWHSVPVGLSAEGIAVRGDAALGPLQAIVEVKTSDGAQYVAEGSGDTSAWTSGQVMLHCQERIGAEIDQFADVLHNLEKVETSDVISVWNQVAATANPRSGTLGSGG